MRMEIPAICVLLHGCVTHTLASLTSAALDPVSTDRAARECGICPESIVVGDLSAWTGQMLNHIENAPQLRVQLAQAEEGLELAMEAFSDATEQCALHPLGGAAHAQYQSCLVQLQNAQDEVCTVRDMLFQVATSDVPSQKVAHLVSWKEASQHAVPPEFRIKAKSHTQWLEVVAALRSESRLVRNGEELPPEQEMLLAEIRSDPEVIAATSRLISQVAMVQAYFDAATNP